MASVLMGLGSMTPAPNRNVILFYVPLPDHDTPSFQTINRDTQFNWVNSERLSRDPAMQFTGPGEENITIDGKMYPYHFGGLSTLKLLREAGNAGKPMMLARFYPLRNPTGYASEVIGNFVIKRLRTVENNIGTIGIAHKIDFTLELQKYGDDVAPANVDNDFIVL